MYIQEETEVQRAMLSNLLKVILVREELSSNLGLSVCQLCLFVLLKSLWSLENKNFMEMLQN